MQMLTNSEWDGSLNAIYYVFWIYIIDIGTRYIPNMKTCSLYHWYQKRNKPENKCTSQQQRYLFIYLQYLYLFNYKALFVCVKDSAYLKTAIPTYCFNIFGSIFGVLFSLLIKKLILESKTIWQSMRTFSRAVRRVRRFPHMDKEETFFFLKAAH